MYWHMIIIHQCQFYLDSCLHHSLCGRNYVIMSTQRRYCIIIRDHGYEITVDLFFCKNFQLLYCHLYKPKLSTALHVHVLSPLLNTIVSALHNTHNLARHNNALELITNEWWTSKGHIYLNSTVYILRQKSIWDRKILEIHV